MKISTFIKEFIKKFMRSEIMNLSSAISFYAVVSLLPILTLFINISSSLDLVSNTDFIDQIESFTNENFVNLLKSLSEQKVFTTTFSIIFVIFASSALFIQLNRSMRKIWNTQREKGVLKYFKRKILFAVITIICFFIAAVSISIAAILNDYTYPFIIIDNLTSIIVFTITLFFFYKFLIDVEVKSKFLFFGALITSILFSMSKNIISYYLQFHASNSFNLLSSIILFLLWIYYLSIIFLSGSIIINILYSQNT